MTEVYSFWNFSIRKVLRDETDSFIRSRLRLTLILLAFTLFKIALVIVFAVAHHEQIQAARAVIVLIIFSVIFKYVLYKPAHFKQVSCIVLITAVLLVWSNVLFIINGANLVTLQIAIMTMLCSFYLLGNRWSLVFSVLAFLPVILHLFFKQRFTLHHGPGNLQLSSPGYEITATLNFITIAVVHYLFYRSFQNTLLKVNSLNKQLQASILEVKALAHSRSMFFSSMSHELRTPLNAVIGITDLLQETDSGEQKENLDILEFSAVSLLSLVNDVLDFNKIEHGRLELEAITIDLPQLLEKVCSVTRLKARSKNLKLSLHIDAGLSHFQVISDPTRITQIIYNLLGNAIKFTHKGEVQLNVTVLEKNKEHITVGFEIRDQGIGIPADKMQAIFEPFVQASAKITRQFGGTGLGLAIVKSLLTLFNSEICVESQVGKGTVFSFVIDFACDGLAGASAPKTRNEIKQLNGLNILIAEDNPINAMLLKKLLEKWGVNTQIAGNGEEVISALYSHSFDLILMDLQMPLMDGYEAATKIRALKDKQKAGIPIIALTASNTADIYNEILNCGMQDYLSKPYRSEALFNKIKSLILTAELVG